MVFSRIGAALCCEFVSNLQLVASLGDVKVLKLAVIPRLIILLKVDLDLLNVFLEAT